ncbi:hypothetical protein ACOSQ2_017733 [Xanthoceras sorbifolium]
MVIGSQVIAEKITSMYELEDVVSTMHNEENTAIGPRVPSKVNCGLRPQETTNADGLDKETSGKTIISQMNEIERAPDSVF